MTQEEKLAAIAAEGREVVDLQNIDPARRHAPRHGIMCYLLPAEETARDAEEAAADAAHADYIANHKYKDDRAAAYPPIGDQLDAIWKELNQDRLGGKALIQEADDRLNEVLAVKAAHPKP